MSITLSDVQDKVTLNLQEEGQDEDLGIANITTCIHEAVRDVYSKDRPRRVTLEIDGDGTFLYSVTTNMPLYVEGFSQIDRDIGIEYPVDDDSQSKSFVDNNDWELLRKSDGIYLFFRADTPSATEQFRLTHTAYHQFGSDAPNATIDAPATDLDAIANLSTSIAFQMLATKFADESPPTIQVDTFNRQTKFRHYVEMAKMYMQKYRDSIGKPSGQMAADAIGDWDSAMQNGEGFLTHNSRYR